MNILQAARDPNLFASWFDRGDWTAWWAFLAAVFGLEMDEEQLALFKAHTGRDRPPESAVREAWLIIGRRGGKSFVVALIAVYLAAFFDYRKYLQPGERGTVLILAADRRQARTIYRYARALVRDVPMIAALLERETADGLELSTGVNIEIATASYKTARGYTVVAALLDEIAFWHIDGANPDHEIVGAIQPGMATIPNAMLLALSSPYAKQGELYRAYREHYGVDDPEVLVWQADTRSMNPTVPQSIIDRAYDRDPAAAQAEYGAKFRDDLEQFVAAETVERCTRDEPIELPAVRNSRYVGFVDPSGGSADSMTLAIAHRESNRVVIDLVRECRPPFSPEAVVGEFAEALKEYGLRRVTGDRYGGEWPRERFREAGIEYDVADRTRTDLYRDCLPMLNGGTIELPPVTRLTRQFSGLQRRKGRSGKDMIDHPPGSHDDLANAVAGAATMLGNKRKSPPLAEWL